METEKKNGKLTNAYSVKEVRMRRLIERWVDIPAELVLGLVTGY